MVPDKEKLFIDILAKIWFTTEFTRHEDCYDMSYGTKVPNKKSPTTLNSWLYIRLSHMAISGHHVWLYQTITEEAAAP